MLRGYRGRMITRTRPVVAFALSLVALGMLSGCAPQPEPEPTPTALFASEEEAFKAAEETYRAYTDAQNKDRAGDEVAKPQRFLISKALEAQLSSDREFREQGIAVVGSTTVADFAGVEADISAGGTSVIANVCIDASELRAIDSEGADVAPADRAKIVGLSVTFKEVNEQLLIAETATSEHPC